MPIYDNYDVYDFIMGHVVCSSDKGFKKPLSLEQTTRYQRVKVATQFSSTIISCWFPSIIWSVYKTSVSMCKSCDCCLNLTLSSTCAKRLFNHQQDAVGIQ